MKNYISLLFSTVTVLILLTHPVLSIEPVYHPRVTRGSNLIKAYSPVKIKNLSTEPLKSKVVPLNYPVYKQCDSKWGSDVMVTKTICQVGCLMSSVSMGLAGHNITIDGLDANPGTLNSWLKKNDGYDSSNDLKESVVPNINPSKISWIGSIIPQTEASPSDIKKWLNEKTTVVIANVMHGRHFVLVVGYEAASNDTFYVNDPGFSTESYSYQNDIIGWRVFDMSF